MPKYFCEYCGVYLTHSAPGGRKQHGKGKKHIQNKIKYYSQFLIDFQRQMQNGNLYLANNMAMMHQQQTTLYPKKI